jgi:hypothetical protein
MITKQQLLDPFFLLLLYVNDPKIRTKQFCRYLTHLAILVFDKVTNLFKTGLSAWALFQYRYQRFGLNGSYSFSQDILLNSMAVATFIYLVMKTAFQIIISAIFVAFGFCL